MSDKATSGVLTPAYGRDYKSRKAIVEDVNACKDFTLNTFNGGGYVNLPQLADGAWQVRYGQLRKVAMIQIRNGVAK